MQLYESKSPCTYVELASELGIDAGTLSKWVVQARPNEGPNRSDNPFQMAEDLRKLRKEHDRLKRDNEILLKASAFSDWQNVAEKQATVVIGIVLSSLPVSTDKKNRSGALPDLR